MSMHSYLKGLVGENSQVNIVNDNSISSLPNVFDDDDDNAPDINNPKQLMRSRSEEVRYHTSNSSVDDAPSTPRRASSSILDDFRERQRLIRLSMSPGVSPKSPKKQTISSPKSSEPMTPKGGDDKFSQLKEKMGPADML